MPDETRETRVHPLSATTTLVAVLAMMALAAPAPGQPEATVNVRALSGESATVREVAAAVARAARNLLERDHILPGLNLQAPPLATSDEATRTQPAPAEDRLPPRLIVPERLLDLPPPVC